MSKRFFQMAVAFVAVAFFVLAPIACKKAEKPAETPEAAATAGHPSGKKLMAASPKKAAEAVEAVVEEEPVAEEAEVPAEGE